MKKNLKKTQTVNEEINIDESIEDLFDVCIKKGLIEKTEYGYYFKPEFFETLKIYND